jgi:hypothetical protein
MDENAAGDRVDVDPLDLGCRAERPLEARKIGVVPPSGGNPLRPNRHAARYHHLHDVETGYATPGACSSLITSVAR